MTIHNTNDTGEFIDTDELELCQEVYWRKYHKIYNPYDEDLNDFKGQPNKNTIIGGFSLDWETVEETCHHWTKANWEHRHPYYGEQTIRSNPNQTKEEFIEFADKQAENDENVGFDWHPSLNAKSFLSRANEYVETAKKRWANFAVGQSGSPVQSPYLKGPSSHLPQEELAAFEGSPWERFQALYKEAFLSRLHDYDPELCPDMRDPTKSMNWTIKAGACSPNSHITTMFRNWESFVHSTGLPDRWNWKRFDYQAKWLLDEMEVEFIREGEGYRVIREVSAIDLTKAGLPHLIPKLEKKIKARLQQKEIEAQIHSPAEMMNLTAETFSKWLEGPLGSNISSRPMLNS